MTNWFGESTSKPLENPSWPSSSNTEAAGSFVCNICFDLAQDPIVSLCGHIFCWPCLYKWLHIHFQSHECPVCKALIEEEKLVPLYGRGKTSPDPRSKSIPGCNIPNRPTGKRLEMAPPPEQHHYHPQHGFGFMVGLGGCAPMATARFGNFTLSASFGGLFSSLFNFQVHGYPVPSMYGPTGLLYGFPNALPDGGNPRAFNHPRGQGHQDVYLKRLLLIIAFCVLLARLEIILTTITNCILAYFVSMTPFY